MAANRSAANGSSMPAKHFNKKQLSLLNALCHANSSQRTAILRSADKPLVKCICEAALNVLQGVVRLKDSEKKRLKKHRNILRKLTTKDRHSWQGKKRAIVQNGGSFLPILLAPIISAVVSKIFGGNSN